MNYPMKLKRLNEIWDWFEAQAHDYKKNAICKIQKLDDSGYSGHMSYILHLLYQEEFKRLYLSGGVDPGQILDFGKSHDIVMNRMM